MAVDLRANADPATPPGEASSPTPRIPSGTPSRRTPASPRHRRIGLSGTGAGAGAPVLVAFADHAECRWLHLLRPGFRHCFAVIRQGPLWLSCEALKDRIELAALDLPEDFDLARFYSGRGYRVLVGRRPAPPPRRAAPPVPLTCVSVVKRLLGVRAPWVWTPWQLHRHLLGPDHAFERADDKRDNGEVDIEAK